MIDSSTQAGSGIEEEDPVSQVMLKSIQDPELIPIYDNLPDLGQVLCLFSCRQLRCLLDPFSASVYQSVRQYSYVNTVGMGVVTLQNVQSQVGMEKILYVAFVVCWLFLYVHFFLAVPLFKHCCLRLCQWLYAS